MKLDLNGVWRFRKAGKSTWYPATVPGCVHTDLQANDLIPDPFHGSSELELSWIEHTDFEYRREFTVTEKLLEHKEIHLVFDGLDTLAEISINGSPVAKTENMFISYRFPVAGFLRRGSNTLSIIFRNPVDYINSRKGFSFFNQPNDPVGGASAIRKMQCSFGWDWGPRLPTCGIFRPARLEAFSGARISHTRIVQRHGEHPGKVVILCTPELSGRRRKNSVTRASLSRNGRLIDESYNGVLTVPEPELWWPCGSGPQPLYDLRVDLLENDMVSDTWKRRVGLRTITLDRRKDQWGQSFRFLVNGIPIYAKGANWIPPHSFPSSVTGDALRDLIRSSVEAHFNMLRVWGGGIYEEDLFYDLCDRYGIMIWHDFMFSCSLYPRDDRFMRSVSEEARCQTRRLAHHPCMALWCGNNELEYLSDDINSSAENRRAYTRLFHRILPGKVRTNAPDVSYWPSSPHDPGSLLIGHRKNEKAGDQHYWDVWHGGKKPETVRQYRFRFWSEFGMQSYCSVDTALQFAGENELNIFSPTMENHQKHPLGNALIFRYIARRYRFPKDFASLVHLSQVNQAHCVGMMVEHQRSCMPRTMGSLYWQLNDCWPVFSWSSIDFGGQWKALHYTARRFFAPALVMFRLIGEETTGKINRQITTVSGVDVMTAFDGPGKGTAELQWDLFSVSNGTIVKKGEKRVVLRRNEAVVQKRISLEKTFSRYSRRDLVMRGTLVRNGKVVSRSSVFFTAPRFIELPKERVVPSVKRIGANRFELIFNSGTFQHQFSFHLPGVKYRASDNFFDLFPGETREVTVRVEQKETFSTGRVKQLLQLMSVADTY